MSSKTVRQKLSSWQSSENSTDVLTWTRLSKNTENTSEWKSHNLGSSQKLIGRIWAPELIKNHIVYDTGRIVDVRTEILQQIGTADILTEKNYDWEEIFDCHEISPCHKHVHLGVWDVSFAAIGGISDCQLWPQSISYATLVAVSIWSCIKLVLLTLNIIKLWLHWYLALSTWDVAHKLWLVDNSESFTTISRIAVPEITMPHIVWNTRRIVDIQTRMLQQMGTGAILAEERSGCISMRLVVRFVWCECALSTPLSHLEYKCANGTYIRNRKQMYQTNCKGILRNLRVHVEQNSSSKIVLMTKFEE